MWKMFKNCISISMLVHARIQVWNRLRKDNIILYVNLKAASHNFWAFMDLALRNTKFINFYLLWKRIAHLNQT